MSAPQKFSVLLEKIGGVWVGGENDPLIRRVTSDSRQADETTLFVAIQGEQRDGHDYVDAARRTGALAVLVLAGRSRPSWSPKTSVGEVADTRQAIALIAAELWGPLKAPLGEHVVGITGTNGKTTTCYILESIFASAGGKPGILGTVNYRVGDMVLPAPLTTPSAELLWQTVERLEQNGATHLVMEVSSHALHQHRVDGMPFNVAGFTNLSQDHLDYHKDWDDYLASKARLFWELINPEGRAVLPAGEPAAATIRTRCVCPVWTYSVDPAVSADLVVTQQRIGLDGIRATVQTPMGQVSVESPLLGAFNLSNLVLACGLALALETPIAAIEQGIRALSNIPGRMERLSSPEGFQVVVDYSHTPDALKKALATLRPLCNGRLIAVFGCGGDRDTTKRKPMGEAAALGADLCIVTSDNPRTEDPQQIVDQILEGVRPHQPALPLFSEPPKGNEGFAVVLDRRKAIGQAIQWAQPEDMILVAGKGHEDYQVVGTTKYPFDDRRIAQQAITERAVHAGFVEPVDNALFSVGDVVAWTGGSLLQGSVERELSGARNDSRALQANELFIALVAERDGHDFLAKAVDVGATAVLVSRPIQGLAPDVAVIQVEDTLRGMGAIAAGYKASFPALQTIAVTGSNGKTTTKEMLASILREMGPTLSTAGNFNNLIGLPLTLFRLRQEHRYAVLEMGMNAFGEIAQLAKIAKPDVGIVTCVASAHLEGLGSIEGVARAKGELFDALGAEQWAVIHADDPYVRDLADSLDCRKVYFSSLKEEQSSIPVGQPSVCLQELVILGVDGFRFDVVVQGLTPVPYSLSIHLPLVGRHQVSNALAAIAAALVSGASTEAICAGLLAVKPTGRRMRHVETSGGIHLLDDCYNSNPHSCQAALRTLQELGQSETRIAILGDMLELGPGEEEAHAEVGRFAASQGVTHLLGFGPLSSHLIRGAQDAGLSADHAVHFLAIDKLWQHLQPLLTPKTWTLVKASRGMRLERVSEKIEG